MNHKTRWLMHALLLLAIAMRCGPLTAHAQNRRSSSEVSPIDIVPRDADLVVWTDDAARLSQSLTKRLRTIIDLGPDQLDEWEEAELKDDRYKIFASQMLVELRVCIELLEPILFSLERPIFDGPVVFFSVNRADKREHVVIASTDATQEELAEFFAHLNAPELVHWWQQGTPFERRNVPPESSRSPQEQPAEARNWLLHENWLIASTHSELSQEIATKWKQRDFVDSLTKQREFLLVRNHVPRGARGSIRFHLSGSVLEQFVAQTVAPRLNLVTYALNPNPPYDRYWKLFGFNELKALGGNVISDDERFPETPSAVTIEAFGLLTQPRRGIWKLLDEQGELRSDEFPIADVQLLTFSQIAIDGSRLSEFVHEIKQSESPTPDDSVPQNVEGFMRTWILSALFPYLADHAFPEKLDSIAQYSSLTQTADQPLNQMMGAALRFSSAPDRSELDPWVSELLNEPISDFQFEIERQQFDDRVRWSPFEESISEYLDQVYLPKVEAQLNQSIETWRASGQPPPGQSWDEAIANTKASQALALERTRANLMSQWRDKVYQYDQSWISLPTYGRAPSWDAARGNEQLAELQKQVDGLSSHLEMESKVTMLSAYWPTQPLQNHHRFNFLMSIFDTPSEHAAVIADLQMGLNAYRSLRQNSLYPQLITPWMNDWTVVGGSNERGIELRAVFGTRSQQ